MFSDPSGYQYGLFRPSPHALLPRQQLAEFGGGECFDAAVASIDVVDEVLIDLLRLAIEQFTSRRECCGLVVRKQDAVPIGLKVGFMPDGEPRLPCPNGKQMTARVPTAT
jgi:hypothetical protein